MIVFTEYSPTLSLLKSEDFDFIDFVPVAGYNAYARILERNRLSESRDLRLRATAPDR
jgi:hypothetical protein